MYAAILAGGVGTRLWPRSRQTLPKQFVDITGTGRTMLQATVDRLDGLVAAPDIYVITGRRYRDLVQAQLPEIPAENIIVEPSARNTGPAIGLACTHIYKRDPNAIIALLHADHVIQDQEAYRAALRQAERVAQEGYVTVLGITPVFAHTGYGYIKQTGAPLPFASEPAVYNVERFLEKPNLATAQQFLADGGYYWNAGNFISRVETMLGEFERQLPEIYDALGTIGAALGRDDAEEVLANVWENIPSISIDHGVMEHAQRVAVVPLDAGWNDVGSWDALETVLPVDGNGNCLVQGESILVDSRGSIVSGGERIIVLIGVDDLVVVDSADAVLVGHKSKMQQVKDIVETLQAQERGELL